MSAPSADEDDTADELADELDERAADVLEDGEFVSFDEHNDERD